MRQLLLGVFLVFPLLVGAQEKCNCCAEEQLAFDFWVGQWHVTDTDGKHVGDNTIEKVEAGCVLKENWTSAKAGFTGTSYNFYNKQTKQWEQLWIDNSGNHLKLKGSWVGNAMVLASAPFKREDGKNYVNRITWTPNKDGTVRQLWEVLQSGAVVNTVFNGIYHPKQ